MSKVEIIKSSMKDLKKLENELYAGKLKHLAALRGIDDIDDVVVKINLIDLKKAIKSFRWALKEAEGFSGAHTGGPEEHSYNSHIAKAKEELGKLVALGKKHRN